MAAARFVDRIWNPAQGPKDKSLAAAAKRISNALCAEKKPLVLEADKSARKAALDCATEYRNDAEDAVSKALEAANNAIRNAATDETRDSAQQSLNKDKMGETLIESGEPILHSVQRAFKSQKCTYDVENLATSSCQNSLAAVRHAREANTLIQVIINGNFSKNCL